MSDDSTAPGWVWTRFRANYADPRPVTFPPPGPYWVSGEAADGSYAVVVAYLPAGERVATYWPEAEGIEAQAVDKPQFTDRFPRPPWWVEPEVVL